MKELKEFLSLIPKQPTVEQLRAFATALAAMIQVHFGERSAAIVMIGVPDGPHDTFAADAFGSCLTTRGLLVWGERAITAHVDRGDSSVVRRTP